MKTRASKIFLGSAISAALAGTVLLIVTSDNPDDRFSGGASDGSASAFLLSTPESELPSVRFSGSAYDGFAVTRVLQADTGPGPESVRFSGGAYDGADMLIFNPNGNIGANLAARFYGGISDGYAATAWLLTGTTISPGEVRFFGGGYDGHSIASLLLGAEISPDHLIRFSGGSLDGYGNVAIVANGQILLSPRFFGGGRDGYSVAVGTAVIDMDRDMLPDWWEYQWFNDLSMLSALSDYDADGATSLEEFVAGTDPTDPTSIFRTAIFVASWGGKEFIVVEWDSIPGRYYNIFWSTNLLSDFQSIESQIEHPQNSYTELLQSAGDKGFYKVDVRLKGE